MQSVFVPFSAVRTPHVHRYDSSPCPTVRQRVPSAIFSESFLSYLGQDLYTDLDDVTEAALRAHIDAACARIGDEEFLSGGVERLRRVEQRNSETARALLER